MNQEEFDIILKCARREGNRFRIPPEELIGEGYLAMADAKRTYKKEKGKPTHHLRKSIKWRIRNYILKYEREKGRYKEDDKDMILNSVIDEHDKEPFSFLDYITLTSDCLEIIRIVKLNLDFLEEKQPKRKFARLLRSQGWSLKRIHGAYRELRNVLKKGR